MMFNLSVTLFIGLFSVAVGFLVGFVIGALWSENRR